MGNKTSILDLNKSSQTFRIDIVYSTDFRIPMKKNKWLTIDTDKMILRGIKNTYRDIKYDLIEGWTVNSKEGKIKFVLTDDNKIIVRCLKIKELVQTFKNEIIFTMINHNFSENKINDACRELKISEFYL